ncbi:MAG: sigma 54-interacting transcriptional regulator [Aliidongia sp.]
MRPAPSRARNGGGSGRFELANRGTLFLDEIANAPLTVQETILRVVEYGTFERVGGSETIKVDVRLIAATNVDLPAMGRGRQVPRRSARSPGLRRRDPAAPARAG